MAIEGTHGVTDQIDTWFTHHPPKEQQLFRYNRIREQARTLAFTIHDLCPPGPDTTAAIRKLREAVMTANAAIACGESQEQ